MIMTQFRVAWIIDLEADNVHDAAEQAAYILENSPTDDWVYEVTDGETGKITEVDLSVTELDDDEPVQHEKYLTRRRAD